MANGRSQKLSVCINKNAQPNIIKMKKLLLFLLTVICTIRLHATTWDEPWADEVIKKAESFVLAKVISSDEEKGISILIIKTLSGKELKDTILISNFYSLRICSSSSDHGEEFHIEPVDSCYFFITQNKKGEFCIATPTTGFDYVLDGQAVATYRHSYHQASVPISIYEKTMTAVFNNYHKLPYDTAYMVNFVNEHLKKAPAGFTESEINTFFLQHVALECVHHLKLNINEGLVLLFMNDKKNFHNQVSAARAMVAFDTETAKRELVKAISDTTNRNFMRVMCIWTISEFNPKNLKTELQKIEQTASDEQDNFGGNIMDPRICTHIPSLKTALQELLEKL
jgi:hypothetical protein